MGNAGNSRNVERKNAGKPLIASGKTHRGTWIGYSDEKQVQGPAKRGVLQTWEEARSVSSWVCHPDSRRELLPLRAAAAESREGPRGPPRGRPESREEGPEMA